MAVALLKGESVGVLSSVSWAVGVSESSGLIQTVILPPSGPTMLPPTSSRGSHHSARCEPANQPVSKTQPRTGTDRREMSGRPCLLCYIARFRAGDDDEVELVGDRDGLPKSATRLRTTPGPSAPPNPSYVPPSSGTAYHPRHSHLVHHLLRTHSATTVREGEHVSLPKRGYRAGWGGGRWSCG